ncbi:neurensin-2 isoform X2 [Protopterus annectens]|uniref:neurensin-2 isoform X2 n=1 Tax=Protopterus annectens TaxID=7888 RepID=UPI001CF95AE5|nr:neurensin-2 isoform X2 [Protopterus annectens]
MNQSKDKFVFKKQSELTKDCSGTVGFSSGIIILLIGVSAITTGYLVPQKLETIGDGRFIVIDHQAVEYNRVLQTCQLLGVILLSVGGLMVATCMMVTVFCRAAVKEEEGFLSPILKEEHGEKTTPILMTLSSEGSTLPLGISRVQNIQPRRSI